MKIAITKATAGAGKWSHEGWANAFKALGHEVIDITYNHGEIENHQIDLLINSTSHPSDQLIRWRKNNPQTKVAMNVLAWTTSDMQYVKNEGVQATPNNVQYAKDMKADIVFAQYSKAYREWLMDKWAKEGFKLGSMEMAADSTIYNIDGQYLGMQPYNMVYVGGYWRYKGQNIDKWLMPVFHKYKNELLLVGKGWPFSVQHINDEGSLAYYWQTAKVCPNIHEPHSTYGGFDIVERVFKTMYCGGLCVSDHVKEMVDGFGLIPGKHLLTASTPQEYQGLIDEIMHNSIGLESIYVEGQKFVRENHTYINRVKQLLEDIYV